MVTPITQRYLNFGELENSIMYFLCGVEVSVTPCYMHNPRAFNAGFVGVVPSLNLSLTPFSSSLNLSLQLTSVPHGCAVKGQQVCCRNLEHNG